MVPVSPSLCSYVVNLLGYLGRTIGGAIIRLPGYLGRTIGGAINRRLAHPRMRHCDKQLTKMR